MSILVRPNDIDPSRWTWLSLLAGLAVADGVYDITPVVLRNIASLGLRVTGLEHNLINVLLLLGLPVSAVGLLALPWQGRGFALREAFPVRARERAAVAGAYAFQQPLERPAAGHEAPTRPLSAAPRAAREPAPRRPPRG